MINFKKVNWNFILQPEILFTADFKFHVISIYPEISVYLTDFNLPWNFSLPRHWFQFTLKFQFTLSDFNLPEISVYLVTDFNLPWNFSLPCLISIYPEISIYLVTDFNLPWNFSLPRHSSLISIYPEISVYLVTDFNLPWNSSLPRQFSIYPEISVYHWFQFTLTLKFTTEWDFTTDFNLPEKIWVNWNLGKLKSGE